MIINRFTLFGAAVIAAIAFSSAQAAGKFYKWTDDAGVVHYGEIPPEGANAQKVNVHTGTASDDATQKLEQDRSKAESDNEKTKDATENKKISEENAKIIKENCEVYKQNLSALKNSARIREKDAKGEFRYLTDEEKAQREKDAETYINENCK